MKKIIICLLAIVLVLTSYTSFEAPKKVEAADIYFTYYAKNDFVAYTGRGTQYPIAGRVSFQTAFPVKKGSINNGWAEIILNGKKAYVDNSNIINKKPSQKIYFQYYAKEPLSFYGGRDVKSTRFGSIAEDAIVQVAKGTVLNNWVEIKFQDKKYYVEYSKVTSKAPVYFTYYATKDFTLYNERNTKTPKLTVPNGAVVKVKQGSVINGWSRIEYKGVKGYAPYSNISNEKPGYFIYYTTKTTNVFSSSNTSSGVLGTLRKNDPIKIQIGSIKNGWAVVSDFNGKQGYIKSSDIVNKPFYFTRENLVLRQQKSSTSKSVLTIPQGSEVTVLNRAELFQDWVSVRYNGKTGYVSSRYLTLEKIAKETPLNKTIVIDPGHGGHDPGAIGNGLREADVNLSVGKITAAKLEKMGYEVHMTRTEDKYLALNERTEIAYSLSPGAFVSLHMNSYTNSSAEGTETYSSDTAKSLTSTEKLDSDKLASFIQSRLVETLETKDRGTKHNDFYVIDKNYTRSVLIEMGYISNPDDAAIFKSAEGQDQAATAIAQGINDFYKWKSGK